MSPGGMLSGLGGRHDSGGAPQDKPSVERGGGPVAIASAAAAAAAFARVASGTLLARRVLFPLHLPGRLRARRLRRMAFRAQLTL